ncbi:MAG TPA: AmmeMemoRadiSam system radical SAM enzyme [Candidatus Limnocylindrales bacterium]|nr:AmmeMemoRadiSam system radical SAM enzyme [Candidatus Limnocylindrales bacterium]
MPTSTRGDRWHEAAGDLQRSSNRAAIALAERGVAPAILAKSLADGSVRCDLCAHRCLVRPGRIGICGVRENIDGQLVSLVHGKAVAACLDPIEKKPLYHVVPGSMAYSIATRGCNFHCRFCQNWVIAQGPNEDLRPLSLHLPPESVVAEAIAGRARSVAYTYVEPTIFAEYLLDTARLAKGEGLLGLLITNGYQTPEALDLFAPWIDAANVDLKSFSDRFYRRLCGARLAPVLESLAGMRRRGIWVEVTTLLIPGQNDDPGELRELTAWLVRELGPDTPWHVSRFFPAHRMAGLPITPLASIRAAIGIGRAAGLRHVYPGNVPALGGDLSDDTRCPGCGHTVVRRKGYAVLENRIVDGGCPDCRTPIRGLWV